jgi:hypothetical protein
VGSLVLFVEYDTLYAYFNETVYSIKKLAAAYRNILSQMDNSGKYYSSLVIGVAFFVQHKYGFARHESLVD